MIRIAKKEELKALNELIALSSRHLSIEDYRLDQIEDLITYVFGVDTELIEDQTYYTIEKDGTYLACGGWSKRKTLFGGDNSPDRQSGYLDPKIDPAKIRAFFINPSYARQGLGSLLLEYCENKIKEHGFSKIEMMATLPGAKLYKNCGYKVDNEVSYELPNKNIIELVKMSKEIDYKKGL